MSLIIPDINFKHRFVLSKNNIILLCIYFQEQHQDIYIELKQSPNENSNSFYLYFHLGEISACLRISDHNTKLTAVGGGTRNIIIKKGIKYNDVYTQMCNAVKDLKRRLQYIQTKNIFKEVENEKKKD